MLKCKDLTRLIASGDVESASVWQRLWMRLHLMMCEHCRRYEAQMRSIGDVARQVWVQEHSIDRDALARVEHAALRQVDAAEPAPADPTEERPDRAAE